MNAFTDSTVAGNRTYNYTVRAIDSAFEPGSSVDRSVGHDARRDAAGTTGVAFGGRIGYAASRSPGPQRRTTSVSRATSSAGTAQ